MYSDMNYDPSKLLHPSNPSNNPSVSLPPYQPNLSSWSQFIMPNYPQYPIYSIPNNPAATHHIINAAAVAVNHGLHNNPHTPNHTSMVNLAIPTEININSINTDGNLNDSNELSHNLHDPNASAAHFSSSTPSSIRRLNKSNFTLERSDGTRADPNNPEVYLSATGETIHICTHCQKTFNRNSNLTRHKRIHSGTKRFNCSQCCKTFMEKHHLMAHLRTHTGEKPYMCPAPNCHRQFTDRSNCARHINSHGLTVDEEQDNNNNNNDGMAEENNPLETGTAVESADNDSEISDEGPATRFTVDPSTKQLIPLDSAFVDINQANLVKVSITNPAYQQKNRRKSSLAEKQNGAQHSASISANSLSEHSEAGSSKRSKIKRKSAPATAPSSSAVSNELMSVSLPSPGNNKDSGALSSFLADAMRATQSSTAQQPIRIPLAPITTADHINNIINNNLSTPLLHAENNGPGRLENHNNLLHSTLHHSNMSLKAE
jgi:uncharacterized C2H2 Zn-finger protein